eukprot:scaffold85902_cov43-Phaeocystis_antarctica.AAC.1
MAGHGSSGTKDGSGGGSNNNNDDESEELAEAKRDMSELREQLHELRQSNKELKAEVDAAQRVPMCVMPEVALYSRELRSWCMARLQSMYVYARTVEFGFGRMIALRQQCALVCRCRNIAPERRART